jgi:hypothetical protein
VKPGGAVVVSAGRRVSRRRLEEFLRAQADWIDRNRRRMEEYGKTFAPFGYADGDELALPEGTFRLVAEKRRRGAVACRIEGDHLIAAVRDPGAPDRRAHVRRAVRLWVGARLLERARVDADRWAARLGVTFQALRVGDQRSEWGACSHRGTISLNWRLALVPAPVAEYVLVHELCHLRHHDHSGRFWGMVEAALPDAQARRAWLRRACHRLMTY